MLVYVASLLLSYLVHGPWRDPEGYNFPQSRLFHDAALWPNLIADTRLNWGFVVALAACYRPVCSSTGRQSGSPSSLDTQPKSKTS